MNGETTFRAAVIGCGQIGSTLADDPLRRNDVSTHAEAYVRSERTRLVALCDVDATATRKAADRWRVEAAYTDVEQMLRNSLPDVVSICTPDVTHAAVTRLVIDHGHSVRAIFCEKPLAMTLADAQQIVAAARRSRKLLATAYTRRYAANLQHLRDFINSGELGEITSVFGWYTKGVLHNGSHWFDLLRMLAGEVNWVEAVDRLSDGAEDPALDVVLGLEGGAVATLRAVDSRSFHIFEMDVICQRGRAQITDSGFAVEVSRAAPSSRYSGFLELAVEDRDFGDRRNLMLNAIDDLTESLTSGRPPLCTGDDGVAALRIGLAAIKAARAGARASVEKEWQ